MGKPDDKELIGQALTFFDRDIMDSIFSLYHDGEEDVTPAMVVRSYSGDFKKTSSKKYQKKVEDTMDKLACLTLRIECAEQFELMRKSTRNNCVFEGPLLPLKKKASVEMEGHEKIVYHIYGIPVLYQYALMHISIMKMTVFANPYWQKIHYFMLILQGSTRVCIKSC